MGKLLLALMSTMILLACADRESLQAVAVADTKPAEVKKQGPDNPGRRLLSETQAQEVAATLAELTQLLGGKEFSGHLEGGRPCRVQLHELKADNGDIRGVQVVVVAEKTLIDREIEVAFELSDLSRGVLIVSRQPQRVSVAVEWTESTGPMSEALVSLAFSAFIKNGQPQAIQVFDHNRVQSALAAPNCVITSVRNLTASSDQPGGSELQK